MFVVDANVLLYAANRAAPERARCFELLDRWRRESTPWYLTWGVIYEFMRVSTHPNGFRRPLSASDAYHFVEVILESPPVSVLTETSRHADILSTVLSETTSLVGSAMHDGHTAVLMREHGIRTIVTRDRGFRRFSFLGVVDPLA